MEDLHCPHFSGPIQEPARMNTTSETLDDLLSVVMWDVEINFLLKKGDMKVCLFVIFWTKVKYRNALTYSFLSIWKKMKRKECPYIFSKILL